MSDLPPKDPSGANDPGGAGDPPNDKQTVSYETHQKLLGEKKKAAEKAAQLEAQLKEFKDKESEREKKLLEEQGKWKELAELKDKELADERKKTTDLLDDLNTGRKKTALLKAISGNVPEGAQKLLPLDMVKIGEDGKLDATSVKAAAQWFEKEHSYAVQKKPPGDLPNDAGGPAKKLTVAEWEALPPAEMKKRWNDVDWNAK